ncbi:HAD family hydrolase [Vibrio sp. 404]|uniref:HAD family hydrolase n=1 Tax=Vibrio marinisediminis TaxID=2758441 RepID=A0A7W2FNC7_9VIBR|nr:HAD family hydrolase [Vibrio marinisediminis]MBA5761142.1 HAD family hydrolase [Vibrio marinisediminis]
MNLALFDFDGTITNQDAYTEFLFFATPKPRLIIGGVIASPVILLYKLGLLRASKTRPILSKIAFWQRSIHQVEVQAKRFVNDYLPQVMRANALAKIEWHKQRGDEIYVVSASLSPYLDIWCQQQGIKVVCSRLSQRNQRYTGYYLNGDCSLDNKVRLLKEQLDIRQYSKIYAYGDTYEDLPMLDIADEKYFRWLKIDNTDQVAN